MWYKQGKEKSPCPRGTEGILYTLCLGFFTQTCWIIFPSLLTKVFEEAVRLKHNAKRKWGQLYKGWHQFVKSFFPTHSQIKGQRSEHCGNVFLNHMISLSDCHVQGRFSHRDPMLVSCRELPRHMMQVLCSYSDY